MPTAMRLEKQVLAGCNQRGVSRLSVLANYLAALSPPVCVTVWSASAFLRESCLHFSLLPPLGVAWTPLPSPVPVLDIELLPLSTPPSPTLAPFPHPHPTPTRSAAELVKNVELQPSCPCGEYRSFAVLVLWRTEKNEI